MAALTSSDFTLTNNGSTSTFTGTQWNCTRPSTGSSSWILTNVGYNSGIVILQADLTWAIDGTSSNEDLVGIKLGSSADTSFIYDDLYSAKITSRTAANGRYRLFGGAGTYNTYGTDTAVTKGKAVRIVFNFADNSLKYQYWNGSSWAALGTTQTINIGNSGTLYGTVFYDNIDTTVGSVTTDNMYLGTYASEYTTQYPAAATSIKTVLGLSKASVKTWNGLAIASVKTINGLA